MVLSCGFISPVPGAQPDDFVDTLDGILDGPEICDERAGRTAPQGQATKHSSWW
jgi:hypothetical protein